MEIGILIFVLGLSIMAIGIYFFVKSVTKSKPETKPKPNRTITLTEYQFKGGYCLYVVKISNGEFKAFINYKEASESFWKNALTKGAYPVSIERVLQRVELYLEKDIESNNNTEEYKEPNAV